MALDKDIEDARPYIEKADPDHPSLIDTRHEVADRYNIVNVPMGVWIDEEGTIVRPTDVIPGDNRFKKLTEIDAQPHKQALREWVTEDDRTHTFSEEEFREFQKVPSDEHQQGRAEFYLAQWLWEKGKRDTARLHYERACELAPHDFAIRRGSMRMRGEDPAGPEFVEMVDEWAKKGNHYYEPLTDLQPQIEDLDPEIMPRRLEEYADEIAEAMEEAEPDFE